MDELQKLYDVLVREGKYTKSFEEFQSKWGQDQAYKDKVFDVVTRDGLYTKDKESFFQKYSGGGLVPKPEETVAQPTQPGQEPIDLKKKEQSPFGVAALPSAPSFLDSQKQLPKFEATPLVGVKPTPKAKQPLDFLEPSLQTITPELINKNEEFVVPKMNYQFGDLGFRFEESGATGDWMTATAPNGKTIEISLDPLFSSKATSESEKLKNFIKENSAEVKGLSAIERSYAAENKKFDTQKEVDESIKKVNNDATVLNQEMGSFLKQKNQLESEFNDLSKTPQNLKNTPEYIAKSQAVLKKQQQLEEQRKQLISRQSNIESQSKSLDKAVGRYTNMKASQDAWYEIPLISLAKGVGSMASGLYGMSIDAINQFAPKEMLMAPEEWKSESLRIAKKIGIGEPSSGQSPDKWLNSLSQSEKDKIDSEIRDNLKKRDKYTTVGGESQDPVYIKSKYIELAKKEGIEGPKSDSKEDYYKWLNTLSESKKQEFDKNIAETAKGGTSITNLIRTSLANSLPVNTTEEAYNKIQQGFVGGAITGAIESVPSFLGGGPVSRLVRLYAQAEDATMRDMENNPMFKDVSENEKRLVSAPISIATAVLEEFGLRNVIASKGLLNGVVARALGKSGASTTARTFAEFIRNDVDNMIARGTLKLVGGALAEAETGSLQQGAQLAVEKIYNEVKEKEMYKLPEDAGGVIADILKAGAQEAIGGFVLGMPTAVSAAYTKKGFLGMDDVTFKVFEAAANDENIQKAFVTKLKNQVNKGEITIEQAKETLNNYRNSVGLFKSMPEGLDTEGKKNAMNLLKEKKDLENQIDGKDPALVKKQKDRVAQIDIELNKISENAKDITEMPDAISSLKDDEQISFSVNSLDEIPEQFRDRAVKKEGMQIEIREKIFGLPIGKKTSTVVNDGYRYTLTGKEAKDYAIQKQATDESVLRAGEPQVGLPKVGEGNQEPQVTATGTEAKVTTEGGTEEVKVTPLPVTEPTVEPIVAEPIEKPVGEPIEEPVGEPVAEPTEQEIVDSIVADQAEESANEGYEYADLYNRDPRLAALESQKDMLKYTSGQEYIDALVGLGETQESAIERQSRAVQGYTRNINALENSLKATPAAEPAIQPTATPVTEPTVEPTTEPTTVEPMEEPTVEPVTQEPKTKSTTTRRAAAPTNISSLTKNAMKSLKSIFPDVPVKTFKNMLEMKAFVRKELGDKAARALGSVKGVLYSRLGDWDSGKMSFKKIPRFILLNDESRGATTLPHEIWHAILGKAFGHTSENKALFKTFRKSIEKTFRKNGYNELADKLSDFADQQYYKRRGESAEEWLVQLGAYMTESGFKVGELNEKQKTVLGQLKEIINKYAVKLFKTPIFLEDATADNILEFITTISDSLRRGEDLNKYFKESKLATATTAEINNIMNADVAGDFESTIGNIKDIIAIGKQKKTDIDILTAKAIRYLTSSDAYKNADDIQKEQMYREVRDILGLKQKSAPSVTRLKGGTAPIEGEATFDSFFGKVKKGEKITMTEKQGLYKQIKDLARGAKDAKKAWVEISKDLAKGIKELITKGTITSNQAKNIISKMAKVNMFSKKSVDGFLDYMTKVFENAEYAANLDTAKKLRKDIKKLSKNKDKNANVTDLARRFSEINPSMVDDINEYNEIASKVKAATKGSTIRGEKVSFADAVNIQETNEYINQTLEAQDKELRKQKAEEIQELMGVDASKLSYDEMMQLLEGEDNITKYNEGIIRDTINKMFDLYSAFINDMLENNEDIDFTAKQKDLVKRFMGMNLNLLTPKEALEAVDALSNFMENGSTARMEAVLADYTGEFNSGVLVDKGIKASPISKYWSPMFGKFLAAYTTNLNIVFEKMFKGFNRGGLVEDLSGVTKIKRGNAVANRISNQISIEYVKKFFDRKANGEAFNTAYNSIEREVIARTIKNIPGTEAEIKKEFERRKTLIKETIAEMKKGDAQEVENAALIQKAYDKLLKDSNSVDDVIKKADEVNMEAVDFWIQKWSDVYDDLADTSLNVYNKILERDTNYTPDRYIRSQGAMAPVDFDMNESAFHSNNNSNSLYKKESGVLMKATRPTTLPKNMYLSMSFDKNMANSMHDALVDIHTAIPIRQTQSFLNSDNYRKIVPDSKDAKLLAGRIGLYVQNIRKKNPYANDELSDMLRKINKIANIGVGQALGGVTQPFKQMIPVAMNTIINAGSLNLGTLLNQGKNGFIDRSGYEIANRGVEAQAQIESLNKIIEQAAKSKGAKAFKLIEDANKKWLDIVLVKPDVFIARASWITYYEQSLKKQGIDPNTIDYNTHEVNEKAADYAQRMVDRQQNISDADLAGKMFVSKQASTQVLVKLLMPFASFRMNQSARLGSDLAVLSDNTASIEDRKIAARSLAGFAAEMLTFKMVSAGTIILLGSLAKIAMGKDEDEEEKKKRIDAVLKGQRTSMVTDMLSPIPVADKAVQAGSNYLLNTVQNYLEIPKEEQFSIYGTGGAQEILKSLGMFGIAADRAAQLFEVSKLAATGEYTDDFGKEKTISEKDRQALLPFVGAAILSNVGLAPTEVSSVVRYAVKDAKTKTKSPEEKAAEEDRATQKEEETYQKIEALDRLRENATSQEELDAIDEKVGELEATPEEKKIMKADNEAEKELKKELLTDPDTGEEYDNETELKRYNPTLYNQNFGPKSEWYQDHKAEKEVQKKLNKEIRKMEDAEEGYVAPAKTKRASKRNSDGSIKSSSYKRVRRDANGNVISSFTRTTN
jgi:hypothetical protein